MSGISPLTNRELDNFFDVSAATTITARVRKLKKLVAITAAFVA